MKKIIVTLLMIVALVLVAPTGVQAAVNYFDQTKVVTASASYPYTQSDTYSKVATVKCPRGYKATGGGVVLPDNGNNTWYQLRSTYPVNATTWGVVATIDNDYWTGPRYFYPQRYVVCVK